MACGLLAACGSEENEADLTVARRWLLCEECNDGELDSLRAPVRRDRMVSVLARALDGPPANRRENVRRQLVETYQQLAGRAAAQGRTLPLNQEQYVSHFLGNYEALYQTRAVVGLVAIGTDSAKGVLKQTAERVRSGELIYRPDVVEALGQAVPSWHSITAGVQRTCGIMTDGKAYCWGRNDRGQLGDSTVDNRPTPTPVAGNLRFSSISAGSGSGFHTCGIADDRAYCWGANDRGELGDGSTDDRLAPTLVAGGLRFVGIAAGGNHSCAWTGTNKGYCWGGNHAGQLGDGTTDDRRSPVTLVTGLRVRTMAAGTFHTCADSLNGRLYCWGSNADGQLGDGSSNERHRPSRAGLSLPSASVALGAFHGCVRDGNQEVHCVGNNDNGRLGDGSTITRSTFHALLPERDALAVSAGQSHTCAIAVGSRMLFCWGSNSFGQLGDGTTSDRIVPTPVAGSMRFRTVSAGAEHTCAITADGVAYCWGLNNTGQLGDGTSDNRLRPIAVRSP